MTSIPEKNMQWSVLGATRYFLAAVVAVGHLQWYTAEVDGIMYIATFTGSTAVIGFLLISGYSIASSYERQPKGYYWRRLIRIMPLYVFCVSFSAVLPMIYGDPLKVPLHTFDGPTLYEFICNLFFLQGICSKYIGTNPIVWTLTVEVFFYILMPLLARYRMYAYVIMVASGILFMGYSLFEIGYYSEHQYGICIGFLAWAWLLGFWYYYNQDKPWAVYVITAGGTGLIYMHGLFVDILWLFTWLITCAALGHGRYVPDKWPKVSKLCQLAGDASYPLYLIHIPAYILFYNWRKTDSGGFLPVDSLLYFVLATVLAVMVDLCVDKPVKNLIRKLTGRGKSDWAGAEGATKENHG